MTAGIKALLATPAADLSARARWLLLGAIALYLLAAALAVDRWQGRSGQSVRSLGFGYGVLIANLEDTGVYRVPPGVHYPGVAFTAHRLPFIPYFLLGLRTVLGDDLGRVGLAKCIIFGAVLLALIALVLRRVRVPLGGVLLVLVPALTMPRWILNQSEIGLEEGYLIAPLGLLLALLWFRDPRRRATVGWAVGIGSLLALLLFLKSSMIYWSLALPALVWLQGRDLRPAAIVLALVGGALVTLAAFNRHNSGRFTVGSSWEGWNLYKGNCEFTRELYPPYTLDLLDYEGKVRADRPLVDEWDFNDYFKQRAVDFIRGHPAEFVELALRKAWVFYGEVRPTGLQKLGESRYAKPVNLLQIPWMIIFRLMLWTALARALGALWRESWRAEAFAVALTYLAFLVLYSGFHVVGFTYERHVMPVVLPTVLYLLWRWNAAAGRKPVTS